MNNRRTAPGGQMTHMLSTILAKVTNIEKLLAPAIHNLPDSEILDSKRRAPAYQNVRQDTSKTPQ